MHLRFISLLITLLFISPVLAIPGQYKVIRVVDGDTVVIKYNGKYEKVRMLCVNTFEIDRLRGHYGRLLAYVFVDGQNLNLDLVRQGLSPYYTKYGKSQKYDSKFRAAEKQARKEKLNIWGDPELTKKYLRLKSKWGQREK